MKQSLLAASLLGACSLAAAQSSVTVFGIVDVGVTHVSGSEGSVTGLTSNGRNFSRLGFRGKEDLGGGLSTSSHLEGQILTDGGAGNAAPTPFSFARRSTVSLHGNFGEIRLGRDFAPTWWNTNVFDPGGDGIGGSLLSAQLGNAPGGANGGVFARSSNSIGYFLPPGIGGGFYGSAQHAFGESASSNVGNYNGLRVGYNAGKWNIAAAVGRHSTSNSNASAKLTSSNIGGFYQFDMAKLLFILAQEKATASSGTTKQTGWLLGVTAPIGAGELRATYSSYNRKNSADDYRKLVLGYGYNLSKRTEIYSTYAWLDNRGRADQMLSGAGLNTQGLNGPGGTAKGIEIGIRHSF